MIDCVLDASAVLVLLHREPGEKKVAAKMANAAICSVNFSEVISKLLDAGMPGEAAQDAAESLGLNVIDFDQGTAAEAGKLRDLTRPLGLSLGDRACLATAKSLKAPILTADRTWLKLKGKLAVSIESVR
jgi:PIN domain nuclease of toxin-antitoxin system